MSDRSEREGFNKYNLNKSHNQVQYHDHQDEDGGVIKEQDRLLPIANVGRIMKQILPPNAKISKEAKETMQECVSEFISFVTGEASDKCHKEKRKTVNGDDICWALSTLGFDDYADPLKRYLLKFRESEGERANHHPNNRLNHHANDQLNVDNDASVNVNSSASAATNPSPTASFINFNNVTDRGNGSSHSRQFSNF